MRGINHDLRCSHVYVWNIKWGIWTCDILILKLQTDKWWVWDGDDENSSRNDEFGMVMMEKVQEMMILDGW
jgi:hypothetical protein